MAKDQGTCAQLPVIFLLAGGLAPAAESKAKAARGKRSLSRDDTAWRRRNYLAEVEEQSLEDHAALWA